MAPFYHTQIQTTRKSQSAKIDEIVHETAIATLRAAIWPRSAREWANKGPRKGATALREYRVATILPGGE